MKKFLALCLISAVSLCCSVSCSETGAGSAPSKTQVSSNVQTQASAAPSSQVKESDCEGCSADCAGGACSLENKKSELQTEEGSVSAKITDDKKTEGKSNMVETKSGLKYEDLKVGDGKAPKAGDIVIVHYTGVFEDGSKFDSSRDRGQEFKFRLGMGQVIKGWDEGVASMKVGGQRKLVVPGSLAYGPRGISQGGRTIIPPNATLIFDVELLGIEGADK